MKKSAPKLVVRQETLRVLARLELADVAGGDGNAPRIDTVMAGTGCPLSQAQPPVKP